MDVKVLIVQDKAPLRHMPADAATLAGFEVIGQCIEPGEALALFKAHEPEVVLLDLAMPVEDCLPLVRKLKQIQPSVLIAVCSGFEGAADVSRAFAAGIHRCLRRPYRGDELRNLFDLLRSELELATSARA